MVFHPPRVRMRSERLAARPREGECRWRRTPVNRWGSVESGGTSPKPGGGRLRPTSCTLRWGWQGAYRLDWSLLNWRAPTSHSGITPLLMTIGPGPGLASPHHMQLVTGNQAGNCVSDGEQMYGIQQNGKGDVVKRKAITAVYSPVCTCNAAFLGTVREWARQADAEFEAVPYQDIDESIRRRYAEAEVLDEAGLIRTVFIDLFIDGKLVSSSVPPVREAVARELGVPLSGEAGDPVPPPEPPPSDLYADIALGRIRPVAITADSFRKEMELCVDHHPYGRVQRKYRASCLELKQAVFLKTLAQQEVAGLFLEQDDRVLGLLEVHPREVLRDHGFVTGRKGDDNQYFTVGCYEVAWGLPRVELLDVLMSSLLDMLDLFDRPYLEGVGKLEWPGGFRPYWVYDKYGFERAEELRPGWYVMTRRLDR